MQQKKEKLSFNYTQGKIQVFFRPYKKQKMYDNLYDLKINNDSKLTQDDTNFSFYNVTGSNKISISVKLYDDEFEDQHHTLSAFTLNLPISKEKNHVFFLI